MALSIRLYNAPMVAALDAWTALVNTGGAGSYFLRSGSQPAINAALTGTVLRTFPLPNPAFAGSSANGTFVTADLLGEPISDATGPAFDLTGAEAPGYMALVNGAGTTIYTGSVGSTPGSFNFILDNLVAVLDQQITIVSPGFVRFPQA